MVTRSIYFEATKKQDEMGYLLRNLEAYNPRNSKSFFDCYVIKRKDEKYAFSNKLVDTIGEEKIRNMELFQKKLKFWRPNLMLRGLRISGLSDLKDEIEKMPKNEKIIEQPDRVLDIVEETWL